MKPKKVPRREEKDGELQKLKNRLRNLEKENNRLKSELRTYEQAFKKTTTFLRDNTKEISVERLIEAAKNNNSLKEIKKQDISIVCKFCFSEDLHISYIPAGKMILCRNCRKTEVCKDDRRKDSEPITDV